MTVATEHPLLFLEEAVRRAPRVLSYRTLLAEACVREGGYERAIEILASSLDRDAKPRTIYVLALALLAIDRNGEAKSAATEVIRLNPEMDRAYYIRGLARRAQGDLAGALADLRCAIDARQEAEYAFAFARTAVEAASATPPAVTPALLKSVLRSLDGLSASEGSARERQHLGALLAFALEEPAKAVERLFLQNRAPDPKLALLRGYALLATGRGAEATSDLRVARDVPETNAAASLLLTAYRERGRVRPSLADALLAAGAPAWPGVSALTPLLLPPPSEPWMSAGGLAEDGEAEDSIDLDFDSSGAPAPKTPGSETETSLDRARAFLAEGKHDAAVRELEHAWDLVRPGTSPLPSSEPIPRHRLQALAEALAAAYEQSSGGPQAPRRVRDEELYAAGARYPAMLRSLVWRFTDHEPREDGFALDVLVTAVESTGVLGKAEARDVLRHLSASLRLELEDAPDLLLARVELLERLHRVRPTLAFPRLYLGRQAVLSGDAKRALAFLTDIGGPLADSPHVLMLRASCAESLGDPDRALELYRLAHARAPQLPDLHYRIGRILVRRAAKAAAIEAASAAERARPTSTQSEESSPG